MTYSILKATLFLCSALRVSVGSVGDLFVLLYLFFFIRIPRARKG